MRRDEHAETPEDDEGVGMTRVLVVDDDDAIRAVLAAALREAGFEVDAEADGPEALQRFRRARPDAVVLDLALPGMSGWQFVLACREEPGCSDVPILVVSAEYDLRTVAEKLRGLGVRACLAKPFDVDVLVAMVGRLAPTPTPAGAPGSAG